MESIERQIFIRLTRLYLIALITVALISLVGQIVIQKSLSQSVNDAHVVNLAGRQRMLSQKLCKTALLKVKSTEAIAAKYTFEMDSALKLWSNTHMQLGLGKTGDFNYSFQNSAKIQALFKDLAPTYTLLYQNFKTISEGTQTEQIRNKALDAVLENEDVFLKKMNAIVYQYDKEATQKVNHNKWLELVLFLALSLVLVLEGAFIFQPIASKIWKTIKILTESETNLQKLNVELANSNEILSSTQAQLQKERKISASKMMEGQEIERKRLSQELHDGIGQMLTGLQLQCERLAGLSDPIKRELAYQNMSQLIGDTIVATRQISFNMTPSVLTDYGLLAACKLLCEQSSQLSGKEISFEANINKRLPENIEISLYRIFQEALNNALKHANASRISLKLINFNAALKLEVEDNGKGFNVQAKNAKQQGNGLSNIKTRVELLNGKLKIQSTKNKGTKITAIFDLLNN